MDARDPLAERLGPVPQPADQHARAEDEQQVADDRAGERRLDDLDQPGLQGEERDDQLGDVAERRVEDAADLRAGQRAEPLGREADDPGQARGSRPPTTMKRTVAVGVQPEVEDDRNDADGERDEHGRSRANGES